MAYTQSARFLSANTPLGKDALLLAAFNGEEEMSRLFSYRLEFLSEKGDHDPKAIVGKPVSWTVQPIGGTARTFHGMVRSFAAGAMQLRSMRHYRAEVVPWLWFLTRTSDCRIFQNKTAPEIIEQVFKDLGFRDFQPSLQGSFPKLDYCVQYRETDFDFVSRLMEEFGIFYCFKHSADKHVLVLGNAKTAYFDCAEKSVDYSSGAPDTRHVSAWEHQYSFRSGKWAQTDYNFETPSASMLTDAATLVKVGGNDKFEHFDYPGRYLKTAEGTPLTKLRMEEDEAGYDTVKASGTCSTFTPGGKFSLTNHAFAAEKKGYVITAIRHSALDESHTAGAGGKQAYSNSFTCMPDSVTFRPERRTPRPVMRGPQTAVVVGPKGEEIYTDKYGRVKVQFFWDREGKKDENSSCWVRVSQNWAGKNWGLVCNPRIGQEVIVDFLDGDPDRPIITGRVYNAEQMPPYGLPANQTQTGIKSRSSKSGGAEDFNEICFEDKAGEEFIYVRSQKDLIHTAENDQYDWVGHDRIVTVANDDTQYVEKGNRLTVVETGDDTHQVQKGHRDVQIDMGNDALTIKMGDQTTKLDLGKSATEAMKSIELKVGQSSITIDQKGVTIKGMIITVEGTIQTQVKGLMTQVDASAILQVKGGLTMIG